MCSSRLWTHDNLILWTNIVGYHGNPSIISGVKNVMGIWLCSYLRDLSLEHETITGPLRESTWQAHTIFVCPDRTCTHCMEAGSQTRTVLSADPETSKDPSVEKLQQYTQYVWPRPTRTDKQLWHSASSRLSWMVLSLEHDAMDMPSGEKLTCSTTSLCPLKVKRRFFWDGRARSCSLIVQSCDDVATRSRYGCPAMPNIGALCASMTLYGVEKFVKVQTKSWPLLQPQSSFELQWVKIHFQTVSGCSNSVTKDLAPTFHIFTKSAEHEARRFSSGEKTTHSTQSCRCFKDVTIFWFSETVSIFQKNIKVLLGMVSMVDGCFRCATPPFWQIVVAQFLA